MQQQQPNMVSCQDCVLIRSELSEFQKCVESLFSQMFHRYDQQNLLILTLTDMVKQVMSATTTTSFDHRVSIIPPQRKKPKRSSFASMVFNGRHHASYDDQFDRKESEYCNYDSQDENPHHHDESHVKFEPSIEHFENADHQSADAMPVVQETELVHNDEPSVNFVHNAGDDSINMLSDSTFASDAEIVIRQPSTSQCIGMTSSSTCESHDRVFIKTEQPNGGLRSDIGEIPNESPTAFARRLLRSTTTAQERMFRNFRGVCGKGQLDPIKGEFVITETQRRFPSALRKDLIRAVDMFIRKEKHDLNVKHSFGSDALHCDNTPLSLSL